jgi:hypothetical protein
MSNRLHAITDGCFINFQSEYLLEVIPVTI